MVDINDHDVRGKGVFMKKMVPCSLVADECGFCPRHNLLLYTYGKLPLLGVGGMEFWEAIFYDIGESSGLHT